MAVVGDRRIEGHGTAEQEWQQSRVLDRIPESSFAAFLASAKRIVILSPHPDDEVLGCGGLLAHAAIKGVPVMIVAVTDGEQCYPGHLAWPREKLRAARTTELHRAVAALGLDARCILPLHMHDGSVEVAAETLTGLLRDLLMPSDLVFAPFEADGHPDHDATFIAARQAVCEVGCRLLQYPIWAWHWMAPQGADFAALDLRRLSLTETIRRKKLNAIECFETQTGQGRPEIEAPILPPHVLERFTRPFEVFVL